jgi:hypothetical protein
MVYGSYLTKIEPKNQNNLFNLRFCTQTFFGEQSCPGYKKEKRSAHNYTLKN